MSICSGEQSFAQQLRTIHYSLLSAIFREMLSRAFSGPHWRLSSSLFINIISRLGLFCDLYFFGVELENRNRLNLSVKDCLELESHLFFPHIFFLASLFFCLFFGGRGGVVLTLLYHILS